MAPLIAAFLILVTTGLFVWAVNSTLDAVSNIMSRCSARIARSIKEGSHGFL